MTSPASKAVHTGDDSVRFVDYFDGLLVKGSWRIASGGIFNECKSYRSVKHCWRTESTLDRRLYRQPWRADNAGRGQDQRPVPRGIGQGDLRVRRLKPGSPRILPVRGPALRGFIALEGPGEREAPDRVAEDHN